MVRKQQLLEAGVTTKNLSPRSEIEKDINLTRKNLSDSNKQPYFRKIFQKNAGELLTNISSQLENFTPQPLLNVDGSQTPPRSNGRIITCHIASAAMSGLKQIEGFLPIKKDHRILYEHDHRGSQIIELRRLNLELITLLEVASKHKDVLVSTDGAIGNIYYKLLEMLQLERFVTSGSFEILFEDNLDALNSLLASGRLIGLTKSTNCRCPEEFIAEELPGVKYLAHNEVLNFLLRPGDLFLEKPNYQVPSISSVFDVSIEYFKKLTTLKDLTEKIETHSFMPLSGNQIYTRFQSFKTNHNNLLQIIKNLDFDRQGASIEPFCQIKSDKEAKSHASFVQSKWNANRYTNSDDIRDVRFDVASPTRLVRKNNSS